jgi:hypothetical protein
VLKLFHLTTVDSLMRSIVEGKVTHNRVPEIAPLVFKSREWRPGGPKIVTNFASGLRRIINGLHRLGMTQLDVDIVLSGGIFKAKAPAAEIRRASFRNRA